MADENRGHNRSENPDPQKDGLLEDDITHPEELQTLPACPVVVDHGDRLPQSPVEWLARTLIPVVSAGINRSYLVLSQDKPNDSSSSFKRCSRSEVARISLPCQIIA